jgi:3-deoxy-7-phosphoheptulonate synthase
MEEMNMIIVIKKNANKEEVEKLIKRLSVYDVTITPIEGQENTVLGIVGDTSAIDKEAISINNCVEKVLKVQEPYKKANRKFHPEDTIINANGVIFGGKKIPILAGPCSVESEEQIIGIAKAVQKSGATMLRGGAFKPRSSPYSFQGLRAEGLTLLDEARRVTGLPIISEITNVELVDLFNESVDIIQVGARNMQNFELLKLLGQTKKPILLKRGFSNTIEELLMSAEYIMSGGNENVILCERGIRTFETFTRNTLDLSAVPALKRISHLPVVIDPSHAAGINWMVESLAKAAVAVGADGLIIEVHNDPANALSDGAQSLLPSQFDDLMTKLKAVAVAVDREI